MNFTPLACANVSHVDRCDTEAFKLILDFVAIDNSARKVKQLNDNHGAYCVLIT